MREFTEDDFTIDCCRLICNRLPRPGPGNPLYHQLNTILFYTCDSKISSTPVSRSNNAFSMYVGMYVCNIVNHAVKCDFQWYIEVMHDW